MSAQHHHQTVIDVGRQSQALPALVNFCCFPGLGQLIQGRLLAAIVWWCLHLVGALSMLIGIGFVLWPIIWIACVIDAAWYDPNAALRAGRRGTSPVLLVLAGGLALLVLIPIAIVVVTTPELVLEWQQAFTDREGLSPSSTSNVSADPPSEKPLEKPSPSPFSGSNSTVSPKSNSTTLPNADIPADERDPPAARIEIPKLRLWVDSTGKFKISAKFVSLIGDKVQLEKEDGKVIEISIARLSQEDQEIARRNSR